MTSGLGITPNMENETNKREGEWGGGGVGGRREGLGKRVNREVEAIVTFSLGKSSGLKSFGEQPHQSTMCLY